MKKTLQLVKIYIGDQKKPYFIRMMVNFFLVMILVFAIGEFMSSREERKLISQIDAHKLMRVDCLIDNEGQVLEYMAGFKKKIQPVAKLIEPYIDSIYTKELFLGDRIVLDIKSKDYIQSIQLKTLKGEWFSDTWNKRKVFQAIIPKSLSRKYKLGNQYELAIDSLSNSIGSLKVEIIGVLENDLFYINKNQDYLITNRAYMLISDLGQDIEPKYIESNNVYSFLIQLGKNTSYENFYERLKDDKSVINITEIEGELLYWINIRKPDIVLPTVLSITVLTLLTIFNMSKNYLDFLSQYNKNLLLIRMGSRNQDFIKIFTALSLFTVFPSLLLGYIVSVIGDRIQLFENLAQYLGYVGLILVVIYFISYTFAFLKIKTLTNLNVA